MDAPSQGWGDRYVRKTVGKRLLAAGGDNSNGDNGRFIKNYENN